MSWIKFLVTLVWPFVREMVLGGKSIMEAFKDNKKRVIFAFIVMGSFLFNVVLTGRVIAISREHVLLQMKYDKAIAGSKQNPIHNGVEVKLNKEPPKELPVDNSPPGESPTEVVAPVEVPHRVVTKSHKSQPQQAAPDERFNHLKQTFDQIRERERKEEEAQRGQ